MGSQLAILGLLVEQPLHGYGIERLIEQRGMRKWTSIGFSSIYEQLDQLVSTGLAEVRIETAPGRGKERKVHFVTPEGLKRWHSETLAALAQVEQDDERFLIALSGLPLLDQAASRSALQTRLSQLESRIAALDDELHAVRPVPPHVEAMFSFTRSRIDASRTWLLDFLANDDQQNLEVHHDQH